MPASDLIASALVILSTYVGHPYVPSAPVYMDDGPVKSGAFSYAEMKDGQVSIHIAQQIKRPGLVAMDIIHEDTNARFFLNRPDNGASRNYCIDQDRQSYEAGAEFWAWWKQNGASPLDPADTFDINHVTVADQQIQHVGQVGWWLSVASQGCTKERGWVNP